MTAWVVRAGTRGEWEETALSEGLAGIAFHVRRHISNFSTRDELRQTIIDEFGETPARASSFASQLWNFAYVIRVGDMVILPRKLPRVIAVGRISGDYAHREDLEAPHVRAVEWGARQIPRSDFDQDLLYSLGGLSTVYQPRATDAESRIEQICARHLSGSVIDNAGDHVEANGDGAFRVDLEEQISDRIVERVRQRFPGTRMEYLVASVLRASGYSALETRRGPDGGIDVVAGQGDMGFGAPRLCVQVKSTNAPVDIAEYNRLQGNVNTYGADHGLLVSLGDFTRAVRNENERSYFQVRLWGPYDLVDKLLETYDDLPDDVRAEIPLRNRRILIESEE